MATLDFISKLDKLDEKYYFDKNIRLLQFTNEYDKAIDDVVKTMGSLSLKTNSNRQKWLMINFNMIDKIMFVKLFDGTFVNRFDRVINNESKINKGLRNLYCKELNVLKRCIGETMKKKDISIKEIEIIKDVMLESEINILIYKDKHNILN